MVIDSSALIAILLAEPEADQMIEALQSEPKRLLSAANLLETSIVIEARKGPAGGRELSILLHRANPTFAVHPKNRKRLSAARS